MRSQTRLRRHVTELSRLPTESELGMWLASQQEEDRGQFNLPTAFRIQGELDEDALRTALRVVIARQEALRSVFPDQDGLPVRITQSCWTGDLRVVDFPVKTRGLKLTTALNDAIQQSFDLSNGPLFRATLFRELPRDYLLLLCAHHVIFDGWSRGVLSHELSRAYTALLGGQSERELCARVVKPRLQNPLLSRERAFWRTELKGVPKLDLPLPANRSTKTTRDEIAGGQIIQVTDTTLQELGNVCASERSTLFMALVTSIATTLARYSGQWDVPVGATVANRDTPDSRCIIGFLANIIILRARLRADLTFRAALAGTRNTALAAYRHARFPFESLSRELGVGRRYNGGIVDAILAMRNMRSPELTLPGAVTTAIHIDPVPIFPITFSAETKGAGELFLHCSSSSPDWPVIGQIAGSLRTLMEHAAADPDTRLGKLRVHDSRQQRILRRATLGVSSASSGHELLTQLTEDMCMARPSGIAIQADHEQLTYERLREEATDVSQTLRDVGVRREGLVGVRLERSPAMVAAWLGIMKAGAAYVPLDRSERRGAARYQQINLLDHTLHHLEDGPFLERSTRTGVCSTNVIITPERETGALPPSVEVDWRMTGRDLACAILTSGSTGLPKLVLLEHAGLVNLSRWHQKACDLDRDDRVAQVAAPSFDAATWDIWSALTIGATVVLPPVELETAPDDMREWLDAEGITVCFLPTALAELVVESRSPPRSLRLLLTGGQRLHWPRRPMRGVQFINNYGPTEASVVATSTTVNTVQRRYEFPSIGRPIQNTWTYVLDSDLQPSPVGAVGELYIGGAGVARGYAFQPGLTADRFVPDIRVAGQRMYRTGDLVRIADDGELLFYGRRDRQLKIHGVRVEPAELERSLRQVTAVRAAAAVPVKTPAGTVALIAFLVCDGQLPSEVEIRATVRETIGPAFVPAGFIIVPALPLTANGKVDYRQLETIADARSGGRGSRTSIHTDAGLPGAIGRAIRDVLGAEDVFGEDNFLELGGDSIAAARVAARVASEYGVDLPTRWLLEAERLEDVLERLSQEED
jgi:amino acid adenylation domain-containing protein